MENINLNNSNEINGQEIQAQQQDNAFVRQAQIFDDIFEQDEVVQPEGLLVLPNGNLLTLESQPSAPTRGNEISTDDKLVGSVDLPASIRPLNTVFDPKFKRLLGLNPSGNKLIEAKLGADGKLNSDTLTKIDAKPFGIKNARGITVAPDGTLYVLDGAAKQILVIEPDTDGNFNVATTSQIDLPSDINNARGIAFDSSTDNLQVLSPNQRTLYELNQNGQLVATRDLSELSLQDPQAMVFAQSGDSTDPEEQMSLYVTDGQLGVVELSFVEPPSPQTATFRKSTESLTLVQTIKSSQFSPPSPDPSGITYVSSTDSFVISDGEIEEDIGLPFQGVNVWDITGSGGVVGTGDTTGFSDEPTGISFDPSFGSNGRFFISDDTGTFRGIYTINPGNDGLPGGGDDSLLKFSATNSFGRDSEGVAFADLGSQKVLFIADGHDNEIYKTTIDGKLISSFDTFGFGLTDPEGIEFDPKSGNLFLVSNPDTLFEVSTDGILVNAYDISAANAVKPAGVAVGPSSNDPNSKSAYITDRGVDNDVNPTENDGKIYEFSLGGGSSQPPGSSTTYVSSSTDGTVNGISFKDEDILAFDTTAKAWSLYFDGSDVGLNGSGADVDAFHLNSDGNILLSFNQTVTLPDVGSVDENDIVRFVPTSTGSNTAGTYKLYFDGSDVNLTGSSEDIDAIAFAPDGRLVISTVGDVIVPGATSSGGARKAEDLLAFKATSLGASTSGTWETYFDGSDVGLSGTAENVTGARIDNTGEIYLTTQGAFAVPGVSGDSADIFTFDPSSIGSDTSGSFSSFFDGSANGFGGENIDGIHLV